MSVYIPIISIRPSEVVALAELPDVAKDHMMPLILIKPWLGAGDLTRAINKIEHGFGARPWFAELDPDYLPSAQSGTAPEFEFLRDPSNGFGNWISYVETRDQAVPVLQLRSFESGNFETQVRNALSLGRGLSVRIPRYVDFNITPILTALASAKESNFYIILDYGQKDHRILTNILQAKLDIEAVMHHLPEANTAISATTFPASFSDISSQIIYERQFFDLVTDSGGFEGLIFSDRGSARAVEQGGGGVPRPRIDLPGTASWYFFRSDCVREEGESPENFSARRVVAYQDMANDAVNSEYWDPDLNVWGTQYIKITQLGGAYGINSPAKATACRINIHLTRQALHGEELSSSSFEEDWVD